MARPTVEAVQAEAHKREVEGFLKASQIVQGVLTADGAIRPDQVAKSMAVETEADRAFAYYIQDGAVAITEALALGTPLSKDEIGMLMQKAVSEAAKRENVLADLE